MRKKLFLFVLLGSIVAPGIVGAQSVITTYAGGSPIRLSDTLTVTQIGIGRPFSVLSDGAGGFYFTTTSQRVYRVSADGVLTLIAGNGTTGFSGDGGPAVLARLNMSPNEWDSSGSIAVDGAGNLYIADLYNYRIRKVTPAGIITTVAGTGISNYGGDGGPATSAQFTNPSVIALDGDGNLFVTDNARVRKITPAGIITTVAGHGAFGFTGDGGPATSASIGLESNIALDGNGNVFFAQNSRIRKVTPAGIISTVAGNGTYGFSGNGGPALSAQLGSVSSLTVDRDGNLIFGDNNRIRKVTPSGIITTVAGNGTDGFSGDGGPAMSAQLGRSVRVASDGIGSLFIADTDNFRIREITSAGIISTVAGDGSFGGDGLLAISAQFLNPSGVAVDRDGTLFIADSDNNRLARVSAAGIVTTVAGDGTYGFNGDGLLASSAILSDPTSLTVDPAGNVFIITNSGDGSGGGLIRKINTAGIISSIKSSRGFWYFFDYDGFAPAGEVCVAGLAMDAEGNLYVAETILQSVWKITPSGAATLVAGLGNGSFGFSGDSGPATSARLSFPNGLAVDRNGNLFIADSNNNRIRKVTPSGIITTVAGNGNPGFSGDGGAAVSAQLRYPLGVALDGNGNLFIADAHNNRIRKVSPFGIITTVAGNGTAGFSGDGGPADTAQLNYPTGIAIDGAGHLFIADYNNNRVREVFSGLTADYITPNSGMRGSTVQVTLTGSDFDTTLSVNPMDGITVSNLTPISPILATATFTIAAAAVPGARAVTVTTSTGTSNSLSFTVNPPPTLTSINPAVGGQGGVFSVQLTGRNFVPPLMINVGTDISVNSVAPLSSTILSATLSIAANATLGERSVSVTTTSGGTSNTVMITIGPPLLTISRSGTGAGAVTSVPAGIDCGVTCTTLFVPGQIFALTATPATGSIFAGWIGDADCIDGSVTMTAARNCSARFDLPQVNSTLLRGDYDGDGKSDIAIYRPSTGEWYLRLSTQGYAVAAGNWYFQWGMLGDLPISGDFDGDGKSDISVYRPSTGEWYFRLSTLGYAEAQGNWYFQWGMPGDVPIMGDFDGDGKTDITVYRPSTGEWYIRLSTRGYAVAQGNWYFQWGAPGDQPMAGDFDGDGKADVAVYRPSTGEWLIRLSTQNYAIGSGSWYYQWGIPGDQPVAGDYDGDHKTDIAVYRPATGEWYLRLSTLNYAIGTGNWYFQWGIPRDLPIKADLDGDAKADIAVYRPSTGEWYVLLSTLGYAMAQGNWYFQWGMPGDLSFRR